ncbi:hypothetical protein ARMGADRAFT_795222 [Armillaria gallica]|uniref:3'-5' exonuclease n=1 Tax=Armillaria gallica TaxID=47427 RepID=A0A2H3DMK3_ARMGA|nr:hypothetical protein ARMGADRAFT_795222 [Armillaria gallica]
MADVIPVDTGTVNDCRITGAENSASSHRLQVNMRDACMTETSSRDTQMTIPLCETTDSTREHPNPQKSDAPTPVEPPVLKRPRGRPRKQPQPCPGIDVPKRKRGRPRKQQEIPIELTLKRKRGRPRKTATVIDSNRVGKHQNIISPSSMILPGTYMGRPVAPIFRSQQATATSSMSHILPPPLPPESATQATMEAAIGSLNERILPEYDPTRPLDEDSPDDDDDNGFGDDGDGHEAPNDDEDRDLPSSVRPPPGWLMASFEANLQIVKDSVIGHGASTKITIYDRLKSFWLPRIDTFFILQQRDITPSLLYNPRFFYWDPLALVDQIRCYKSGCIGHLTRHGYWRRPRRIVDLEDAYWLMGVQYKCNCCAVTLQSWDTRVLAKLPETLAGQFPAHLTHRSGMSDSVLTLMRCCFQNGMGAKQFSDSLRVMHRRRYEMLEVEYLQIIESRARTSTSLHQMYEPFPPFDDKTDRGLNTIIPSAQWCRDVYDNFIEIHEHEYHQHTAMLSGEVLAIDHSFKICKHIAKIAGQTVFSGLLTMTNEFGQIRVCDLVPTKAHSQFSLALTRMRHSLETYGLTQPRIIFTDFMGDKNFLEEAFPSLRAGIRPITQHGDLETMELPSHVKVVVQKSTLQIEATVLSLIASMPDDEESVLVIGLDSEWSVDLDARRLGLNDRRQTAIVQLAYKDTIWIFQLNDHIRSGHFPSQLITFLKNPHILKVGRNVSLDLRNLQEESGVKQPFAGGIDIAHLAKRKGVVKNTRIGLADLCAKVLKVHLDKDPATRISPDWHSDELSSEQLRYAALDAWASLKVYEELEQMQVPGEVVTFTPGQDIFLCQDDTNIVACGRISLRSDYKSFEGINITPTRILIEITNIFVPGAIISTHRKQALSEFGRCPFSLVALRSRLRTYIPGFLESDAEESEQPGLQPTVEGVAVLDSPSLDQTDDASSEDASNNLGTGERREAEQGGRSFECLIIEFCDLLASANADGSEDGGLDPEGVRKCEEILEELKKIPWPNDRRSGVLKDIFHVFQMIWIPKSHGLRITFARILRDAIFLPDLSDMKVIISYLARLSPPMTWKECLQKDPAFIKRHCKFVVPPPEILYDIVLKLFQTYGPLKDAQTGLPLFNASTWKTVKNILLLIRMGYISDPPGIPLYLCLGVESNGLPHYRCF